jgi:hypothetical protein
LSDIFLNGGAVMTPPTTGAIFQLVDPAGSIIHEYAAMVSVQLEELSE